MPEEPLENIIAELVAAERKERRKPKLEPEMEQARVNHLKSLRIIAKRMDDIMSFRPENKERKLFLPNEIKKDRQYIQKLIGRFQRKEWYYLPPHKKKQLNDMWKVYK